MLKKTLFYLGLSSTLVIALLFLWNLGIFADSKPPPISNITIVFKSGARMSSSPDTVTKQQYCPMSEHPYQFQTCGHPPKGGPHTPTTRYDPSDRKVTITIAADIVGYGQAKASIYPASADNTQVLNLGGDSIKVGSWGGGIGGAATANPVAHTVTRKVFFYSPIKAVPGTYNWTASGKVEIWGVDWEGNGTVSITQTVGTEVGLSPAGTYSVSVGSSVGVADDISGIPSDRFLDGSGTWTVASDYVCGDTQCEQSLMAIHDHHWICPEGSGIMNGGCGAHVQCKYYIPDAHKLQDKCPGPATSEDGHCSVGAPYRKCTHDCEYYTPGEGKTFLCPGCNQVVKEAEADKHKEVVCGNELSNVPGVPGCRVSYWTCREPGSHKVLICKQRGGNRGNPCNTKYRKCSNSFCLKATFKPLHHRANPNDPN